MNTAIVEYENYYFKLAANKGPMMSGRPLPNYNLATNVCSNVRFVECVFHYDCCDVKFEKCEFVRCALPDVD